MQHPIYVFIDFNANVHGGKRFGIDFNANVHGGKRFDIDFNANVHGGKRSLEVCNIRRTGS